MMGTTDEIVKVLEKGPVFMEDFPEEKWVVAIASPPYPISITPTKIPECWVNSVIIMTGSKFQGILTSKDILMRVFGCRHQVFDAMLNRDVISWTFGCCTCEGWKQRGYYWNLGNDTNSAFTVLGLSSAVGYMHVLKIWGRQNLTIGPTLFLSWNTWTPLVGHSWNPHVPLLYSHANFQKWISKKISFLHDFNSSFLFLSWS